MLNRLAYFAIVAPFVLAFLVTFFIAFYYNLLLNFHVYRRLFRGELGWNPLLWRRIFIVDSYYAEMRNRMWKFMFISFVLWLFMCLLFTLLSFIGVKKPPPAVKPAVPTKAAPPRVLARPRNPQANAVLK